MHWEAVTWKIEAFGRTVESQLDILTHQGSNKGMSSNEDTPGAKTQRRLRAKPVWAEGLRRLYDEVVDEQLPGDFVDLLKKLDEIGDNS